MSDGELNVGRLAGGVSLRDDGIWMSNRTGTVSYPAEGSAKCHEVEAESFWFAHRNACLVETLAKYPPPGPIFDVGGGNGFVAAELCRQGYEAVLVEPSREGARNGLARGIPNVICATLEEAGFHPGAIRAAGLFDVVEHVEDDVRFLSTVRATLAPGGRLYVTVPAFEALWSVDDARAGHFRRYSLHQITTVLESAGFQVELATYLFAFLVAPVMALRAIPSRLGLRDSEAIDHKQEHSPGSPRVRAVLDWLSRRETERLRAGRRIPFGTSCLVVAQAAARP